MFLIPDEEMTPSNVTFRLLEGNADFNRRSLKSRALPFKALVFYEAKTDWVGNDYQDTFSGFDRAGRDCVDIWLKVTEDKHLGLAEDVKFYKSLSPTLSRVPDTEGTLYFTKHISFNLETWEVQLLGTYLDFFR